MKLQQPLDEAFWWDVARQCDYATFFHTPLWHKLATMTFPNYQDISLGAILENGTRLVLPLLQSPSRLPFLHTRISTFAACYGGIIADGPATPNLLNQLYSKLYSPQTGHVRIISNPLKNQLMPSAMFTRQWSDTTYVLNLETDYETLFTNFSRGLKSNIRKGHHLGVTTRIAATLADYQAYFAIYQHSLQRWGDSVTSDHCWELFENGFQLNQRYPDLIRLWLAEIESQIIAGAWVFYWNGHVDYWHGATHADFFEYRAAHVLHAAIIQNAIEQQCRFYDFNPSGGHPGVSEFKGRFGTQKQSLMRYEYEHPLPRIGRWIRARL